MHRSLLHRTLLFRSLLPFFLSLLFVSPQPSLTLVVDPDNVFIVYMCRSCGADAPWRQGRLGHWDLLHRMLGKGQTLSPLMSAPCLKSSCFKIDWLHVVDQGVGADFLGNLFYMLLKKMDGATMKNRCDSLFLKIQEYYREHAVDSQLDHLTLTMILAKPNTSPKLRAKAAEARGLIEFAKIAAERYLDDSNPEESTAKNAARHLHLLYEQLSSSAPFAGDHMAEHSRKFCLLYAALESAGGGTLWRIKPKLHLLQELAEMTLEGAGAAPARLWTYRDEDFGGSMATMSRRRGGKVSPSCVSSGVLRRFCAAHQLPAVVPSGLL